MSLQTLEDLFVHELKDLYDAEHQMIKALPKLARAASNATSYAGFKEHFGRRPEHADAEREFSNSSARLRMAR